MRETHRWVGTIAQTVSARSMAGLGFVIGMLVLAVSPTQAAASAGCSNEAIRAEQGAFIAELNKLEDPGTQTPAALLGCRAYELVNQPNEPSPGYRKYYEGYPPSTETGLTTPKYMPMVQYGALTAQDGEAALFESSEPNSEADGLATNLARRTAGGWTGENLETYLRTRHGFLCNPVGYVGFSLDMEQIAWKDGQGANEKENRIEAKYAEGCGHEEESLFEGPLPPEAGRLFLRDTATGKFELLNSTPEATPQYNPWFDAISGDGSEVVFQSRAQLIQGAPNAERYVEGSVSSGHCEMELGNIYVWNDGAAHLLTMLPNGSAARGTLAGGQAPAYCADLPNESASFTHSVSTDGERIVFYSGGGFESLVGAKVRPNAPYVDGALYLREHPGAPESAGGVCTEAEQKAEPYEACTLQIDVPEAGAPAKAEAGGGQFQWANAATSRIFFTDEQPLVEGAKSEPGKPNLYEYDLEKPEGKRLTDLTAATAEAGDVLGVSGASEDGAYVYFVAEGILAENENSHGVKAVKGEANLYLSHEDTTTFIATLNATEGDQCDWITDCLTARVSQNGKFIAFDSINEMTGYDNLPTHPHACERLTGLADSPCVEAFRYAAEAGAYGRLSCATCDPSGEPPSAEFGWAVIEQAARDVAYVSGGPMELNDAISNGGAVYFETMEKLLGEDENDTWDVYEYGGGEGPTAQLHLISTGKSGQPSYFVNATPDGANVFFFTEQRLLRSDTRTNDYNLYDARAGGGFAEPPPPAACEEEAACHPSYTAPVFSAPGSVLSGPGNGREVKCGKGLVLRAGKCTSTLARKKKPTRQQQLAGALKTCATKHRHSGARRRRCERQVRRRYGSHHNGRRTTK